MEETKKCTECGEVKALDEFAFKITRFSGIKRSCCKRCVRPQQTKQYRLKNKERIRKNQKAWRVKNKEHRREYRRIHTAKSGQDYRKRYPKKYSAHKKTIVAVRMGVLEKEPCFICGTLKDIQAHHEDYSKSLDVTWLCRGHHTFVHCGKINLKKIKHYGNWVMAA